MNVITTVKRVLLCRECSLVGERAFPVAASCVWTSLSLHVTSSPSLQTFQRRGWSRFCSAAVSRPDF